MTVEELVRSAALTAFSMPNPQWTVTGGYAGDLLSWVIGRAEAGSAWLTIMSNQNVAAVALMSDVACVILTEGVTPDPLLLERAIQQEVNLLGSERSTFSMAAELSRLLDGQTGK